MIPLIPLLLFISVQLTMGRTYEEKNHGLHQEEGPITIVKPAMYPIAGGAQ